MGTKYSRRKGYEPQIKEPHDGARFGGDHCGEDYTPEEIEFLKAMDSFKRKTGHMFPTCSETLAVLISLGYRRTS